jgi:hypothetical protein
MTQGRGFGPAPLLEAIRMTVMLYKHPGSHEIHGDTFDYIIVEPDDVEAKVADGWSKTTDEAKNGKPKRGRKPKAGQ